jgi:hypothetical protein
MFETFTSLHRNWTLTKKIAKMKIGNNFSLAMARIQFLIWLVAA